MSIRITSSSVHLDADGGVLAEETVTAEYSAVKTWVEALDPGGTTIVGFDVVRWAGAAGARPRYVLTVFQLNPVSR